MLNSADIKFAKFPVVKTSIQMRNAPWWYEIPHMAPDIPQENFINDIKFFNNELDVFNYWKTFYPGSNNYTIEDYHKNWQKYRYQIWCTRVGNCHWLGHPDNNFNVLYCVIDKRRGVESSSLIADIRHYYIKWMKSVYTKYELEKMGHNHYELSGGSYWQRDISSSRRTW